MSKLSRGLLGGAIAAAMTLATASSNAAMVGGVYTSSRGAPRADHQLHFENRISGDIYLTRTGADGSFASDLPPGLYDLRAERGLVLGSGIVVDRNAVAVDIGKVHDGPMFDERRPFQREGIGPSIVDTGAPATAHLDHARAPAVTAAVPASAPPPAPSNTTPMGSVPIGSPPE